MTPKIQAEQIFDSFYDITPLDASLNDDVEFANQKILKDREVAKNCSLIYIDGQIDLVESLFDLGFKDVYIALNTPKKPYVDIINPLLNRLKRVREEIEKL